MVKKSRRKSEEISRTDNRVTTNGESQMNKNSHKKPSFHVHRKFEEDRPHISRFFCAGELIVVIVQVYLQAPIQPFFLFFSFFLFWTLPFRTNIYIPLPDSMRLLRNPPGNTRLHRRLPLQGTTPALRLRLSSKFLQRLHTDAVLKRGLICSMEEDPV